MDVGILKLEKTEGNRNIFDFIKDKIKEEVNKTLFKIGELQKTNINDSLFHEFQEKEETNEMSLEELRKVFSGEPKMSTKQTVPQMLCSAADIYEQRNKIYGNNYFRFGTVAREILGNVELKSAEDFNRFGILVQVLAKITRYGENFKRGGHDDSLDDLAVYAMMLKELDIAAREVDGNYPF